jgi:hypothetical protein
MLLRPHLLVEVVLLLRALHLLLHAAADLALDLEHLDLRLHASIHFFESPCGRERLQQILSLLEFEVEVGDDGVGEPARVGDAADGVEGLRWHLLVELDVVLEGGVHRAYERLGFEVGRFGQEAHNTPARLALCQHLHRPVRQAQQLDDRT